jgi:hypothetical protein
MADKVFPKGVFGFMRNEKAPSFVLGTLVITPRELVDWLSAEGKDHLTDFNGKKQLKLQITEGREGKLSIAVDTYVPKAKAEYNKPNAVNDNRNDLPF